MVRRDMYGAILPVNPLEDKFLVTFKNLIRDLYMLKKMKIDQNIKA